MRSAAFTLVQNDMVIMKLWLTYYHKYFDDLTIIGNGTKEIYDTHIAELQRTISFSFERTIGPATNSETTLGIVKEKQEALLKDHEWVLYSDCDEYVFANPRKYKDLKDFMEKTKEDKVYCEAFEVFQAEDEEPIDYSEPYLKQRKFWFKNPSYNKPLLARVPINWVVGCHKEVDLSDSDSLAIKDTGLYLMHLKHSDLQATNRDFGPMTTNIQWDLVGAGKNDRLPIPAKIRRML